MTTTAPIPTNEAQQPAVLRLTAQLISFVFHPLFVPLYVLTFLLYVHPSCFAGVSDRQKTGSLLSVGINTVLFPALTVLLLKGLGFISSLYLRTQRERIIPYIASGTFYFWAFWVLKNNGYPLLFTGFMLGVFINAYAALLVNIYQKISMHAMGMGGIIGLFLVIMKSNAMLMTWPLAGALLLTGIVCTARLIISSHEPREVYTGLLLGVVCQLGAALFV